MLLQNKKYYARVEPRSMRLLHVLENKIIKIGYFMQLFEYVKLLLLGSILYCIYFILSFKTIFNMIYIIYIHML